MKKQLLLILMTLLPMMAWADESGKCGDNLTWTYYESTHSLVLTGSGAMEVFKYYNSAPWFKYREDIKQITLPQGLTSLSRYAFHQCSSVTSIIIPNNVTYIGDDAFGYSI